MSSLRDIVGQFPQQRVLVIGDVMLDEYVTGECSRISPEAPVPVVAVASSRTVLGGGAANTAHNVAALGGRATLLGLVGADEAGHVLAAKVADAGVDFRPLTDGRPTIRKVRVLGQQQQLLRLDYETVHRISAEQETRILDVATAELVRSSVLVVSDYAKGLLTEALCQALLERARRAGVPSVVDPRPQHASFYRGCDYLTPNWKESLGLVGRTDVPPSTEAIDEVGALVAARFGSHVLMTLGSRGMKFFDRDGHGLFEEASLAREVFDVSGAGDTVVASFALALAAGCSHRDAARLANRAAGLVVAKLGTATVSPAELLKDDEGERRLLERHELAPVADRLRAAGRRIVTLNGSFDLMHAGHLHFLSEARRQGDVVIVGVNSDRSVRENKGPTRPFVSEDDRARMLLALRDVDYVHIFDEAVPMPFLEQVRPDVHVNGSEYGADCIEAPTVRAFGGRIHIVEKVQGLSTSALVDLIASRTPRGQDSSLPVAAQ